MAVLQGGVPHQVLNARKHDEESQIIARAGAFGLVTIATNMAGRGVDIKLGGELNEEVLADVIRVLERAGVEDPFNMSNDRRRQELEKLSEEDYSIYAESVHTFIQYLEDMRRVRELGGLHVIGSERHEARRIDNQLRGRSGRQGDPGESRFYLSLGDDLMRLFKSDVIDWVLQTLKIPDDVPIENKRVSQSVQSAQEQVEAQNFEMRKNVLKYDDVMNRQRHAIYGDRRRVLEGADVEQQLRQTVDTVVEQYVRGLTEGFVEDWDLEALWAQMRTLYPVTLDRHDYEDRDLTPDTLVEDFQADAQAAYDAREEALGAETMRELERQVLLTVLDRKWREHLYEMDYLREGIGLRAMAQRDPLVEYQREGGDMFNAMMEAFMEEVVGFLFNLDVQVEPAPAVGLVPDAQGRAIEMNQAAVAELIASGPDPDGPGVETHRLPVEAPEPASPAAPAAASAATPVAAPARPTLKAKGLGQRSTRPVTYSAPSESGTTSTTRAGDDDGDPYAGIGRNAPCPCGSGKKYKMCHGRRA